MTLNEKRGADERIIRKWWTIFHHENRIEEIRMIANRGVFSGYYCDLEKLLSDVRKNSKENAGAFYFVLNRVERACFSRRQRNKMLLMGRKDNTTSDTNIEKREWVLIDLDPVRPSGVSATDGELRKAESKANEIRKYLQGVGFHAPVFALSGNGYHLLYRCSMEASQKTDDCIKAFLQALALKFDGQGVAVDVSVGNRARICKLYGTFAEKGADTPERPHRKAVILETPEQIEENDIELFERVAELCPAREKAGGHHTTRSNTSSFDVGGFLERHGIEHTKESIQGGERYTLECCAFNPEHKGAAVIKYDDGKIIYKCFHNSCSKYGWRDFRRLYEPETEWAANTPEEDFKGYFDGDDESGESWAAALTRDKHGNDEKTASNFVTIARYDELFKGIAYNIFTGRYEAEAESPFKALQSKGINDNSLAEISRYLETHYGLSVRAAAVDEKLLSIIPYYRTFHPVKDFIESESWDGVRRVDTLLIDYLGAKDNEFVRSVTRKWVTAAVARIYEPGCKFDYVLTLVGGQGTGKSTFLKTLAGEWFNDTFSFAVDGKQQREALKGKWVIEMAELAGLRKVEVEAAKAFISSTEDFFRAAYARMAEAWPRQCVFSATTNETLFLRSVTGDRRWWVVDVGGAGSVAEWLPKLQKNVGQIWAEALAIFKSGEKLYLSPDMERVAAEQQARHNIENGGGVIGELGEWLNIPLPVDWNTKNKEERKLYFRGYDELCPAGIELRQFVSIPEIKNEFPHPETAKATAQQISFWLLQNGWEKLQNPRKLSVYGCQRVFVRPKKNDDEDEDDEDL